MTLVVFTCFDIFPVQLIDAKSENEYPLAKHINVKNKERVNIILFLCFLCTAWRCQSRKRGHGAQVCRRDGVKGGAVDASSQSSQQKAGDKFFC